MTDRDVYELVFIVLLLPFGLAGIYWLFNGGKW